MKNSLSHVATGLVFANGMWGTVDNPSVSYPDDGHDTCFAVEETSFWFQYRNRFLCALLERYHRDSIFLDVGGGNGVVAKALQDSGVDVVMLEPGTRGACNAVSRGVRQVINAGLAEVAWMPGAVRSVGLFDVLEHIEDELGFLSSINQLLPAGGRLFVSVPAHQRLWSTRDIQSGHYRRYNKNSLKAVFNRAGYHMNFVQYRFGFLVPPLLLMSLFPIDWRRLFVRHGGAIHNGGGQWSTKGINGLCVLEEKFLKRGGQLPIGGSLVAVATKTR